MPGRDAGFHATRRAVSASVHAPSGSGLGASGRAGAGAGFAGAGFVGVAGDGFVGVAGDGFVGACLAALEAGAGFAGFADTDAAVAGSTASSTPSMRMTSRLRAAAGGARI